MPFPYLFPFYFVDPDRAFNIWLNNQDITDKVSAGASFSYALGEVGTFNISIESTATIAFDDVVKIFDISLNTFIFSGKIREINTRQQTPTRYIYDCVVHDYTKLVYDTTGITGTFSGTELAIITDLFATYLPAVIVTASKVYEGDTTTLQLNNNSLSEALEILGRTNDRIWWVDSLIALNYQHVAAWPHASFDFSDSPDFSTTYPYHGFEYPRDNISPNANTTQVSLRTFYSGLQIGRYILVTNSVIGAPFTGATYYITSISGRLLNTIDENIRWEFRVNLRDSTTLPSIFTGHGDNNVLIPRLRNIPTPTKLYEPANKTYVDTRPRGIGIIAVDATTDVTVGDGKVYIPIPLQFSGMNLTRAQAMVNTAGTTNATTIDIYNVTDSIDMLSTAISIASGGTVGTVGTINTTYDDVVTNDVLRVDVTTASTTNAKGLLVILEFALP